MTSDLDIYRAAQATIKGYGEAAERHAGQRADELMAAGDMDGRRTWQRIEDAIRELQREKPGKGDVVH